MVFILSSENVVQYLKEKSLCGMNWQLASLEPNEYRNFNLIVSFTNGEHYLVKQGRFDGRDRSLGCLQYEWLLQQLLDSFPQLAKVRPSIAPIINFDAENSILVVKYLPEYISLDKCYARLDDYPTKIAAVLGTNLARIHCLTYRKNEYLSFMQQHGDRAFKAKPDFMHGLALVSPHVFAYICSSGIEFFKLYQRFPRLHQAVVELYDSYQATCLTHNDARFSNYLIKDISSLDNPQIKLIDWEFIDWGDPAQDLGMLISKYFELWLDSLQVDSDRDLNLSFSSAACPLTKIQPSLVAILENYLATFGQITSARSDFVYRVVQFAGLSLVKRLQHQVECHQPFGNQDVCILQVAKNLLCYPERALDSIFGLNKLQISTTV